MTNGPYVPCRVKIFLFTEICSVNSLSQLEKGRGGIQMETLCICHLSHTKCCFILSMHIYIRKTHVHDPIVFNYNYTSHQRMLMCYFNYVPTIVTHMSLTSAILVAQVGEPPRHFPSPH